MKKSVILSVILLCAGIASVSAQKKEWTPAPLRHWSLSVGASTAGAEIELAHVGPSFPVACWCVGSAL